ncbi:MAG TPA: Rieske 2Fe-2S domain-containing protein [Dehalococcoidia bacterium]|nr:Rieske 2Fe-2S domain-containing protein [Dehalococcoidia bacterium]
MKGNEFRIADVPAGSALVVGESAVFNVNGAFYATQAERTDGQGSLAEGHIDGTTVTCRNHGTQFNVFNGVVLRGPGKEPLKIYRVVVDGDVGRVEEA